MSCHEIVEVFTWICQSCRWIVKYISRPSPNKKKLHSLIGLKNSIKIQRLGSFGNAFILVCKNQVATLLVQKFTFFGGAKRIYI